MVNENDLWGAPESDEDAAPPHSRKAGGDDLWGDSDDDDTHAAGAAGGRETLSLKEEQSARMKHYKEGYKDAISQAREDALQEGFGEGFKQAFAIGIRSGRLVGYCAASKAMLRGLDARDDSCRPSNVSETTVAAATLEGLINRANDIKSKEHAEALSALEAELAALKT